MECKRQIKITFSCLLISLFFITKIQAAPPKVETKKKATRAAASASSGKIKTGPAGSSQKSEVKNPTNSGPKSLTMPENNNETASEDEKQAAGAQVNLQAMESAAADEAASVNIPEKFKKIRDAISVRWFKPESKQKEGSRTQIVSMAGQSKPGTRIYLKTNKILVVKSDKERSTVDLKPEDTKYLPGMVDPRGVFLFELALDPGNYQLGVSFVDPEAQTMIAAKTYFLFMNITRDGVDFGYREEGQSDPYKPRSDFYAVGTGFNFSVFNKLVPEVPSEIRFSSFKFPSLRFAYYRTINDLWRLHSNLMFATGETTTGSKVPVSNGAYIWTIVSGEGIYSRPAWKRPLRDYRVRWGFRGGLQMHSIPFIYSVSSDSNQQSMKTLSYTSFGGGPHFDILTDNEFSYEVFMRLSLPLSSPSDLNMSNSLSIDGSLGATYKKKGEKWVYGLFWYGQWLKYSFAEVDAYVMKNVTGKFDILYSNLEFRIMYDY